MKKLHYCTYTNNLTGKIDHCIVSDGELPGNNPITPGVIAQIPSDPPQPELTYLIQYFSLCCAESDFIRARDLCNMLECDGDVYESNDRIKTVPKPEPERSKTVTAKAR